MVKHETEVDLAPVTGKRIGHVILYGCVMLGPGGIDPDGQTAEGIGVPIGGLIEKSPGFNQVEDLVAGNFQRFLGRPAHGCLVVDEPSDLERRPFRDRLAYVDHATRSNHASRFTEGSEHVLGRHVVE